MKPVPVVDGVDATIKLDKELWNPRETSLFAAQRKAQQAETDDSTDPDLTRLIDLWPLLSAIDRFAGLDQAIRMSESK